VESLGLTGEETFTITGLGDVSEKTGTVKVKADDKEIDAVVRIDTPGEAEYFRHGGILQYVLRSLK
jgi:aconitate hydratase